MIRFKILFQELCARKQGWDHTLSGDLLHKWDTLISELQCSPTMFLPRCFLNGDEERTYTLNGFCDASKQAYAAVVYLVVKTPAGQTTRFVVAKTQVSPLKSQTIPRLELLSVLLLARLMRSVTDSLEPELTLNQPRCYTDSKVALYWILGSNRVWKQFVQHRVSEIRALLPSCCWQHCPGIENPADLPSRGIAPIDLATSELWSCGPGWLGGTSSDLRVVTNAGPSLDNLINCSDFNSIRRHCRVTAHVLRFADHLKRKSQTVSEAQDFTRAKALWIKAAQTQLAGDSGFEKLKRQFNLFQDRGVWRCGGRLANTDIPFQEKHTVLLPRNHHLAALIVREAHERVFHNGVKDTLTEVRSRFWILKGRALIRKMMHQCINCKKSEGKPNIYIYICGRTSTSTCMPGYHC